MNRFLTLNKQQLLTHYAIASSFLVQVNLTLLNKEPDETIVKEHIAYARSLVLQLRQITEALEA